ncbi:MAG: dTDP-4-dehydrorhamnose reductase [Planctomycetota bacterium]
MLQPNQNNTVLITGAGGMVGQEISRVFSDTYKLHALLHSQLDIQDLEKVRQIFSEIKPGLVIHLAAMTDVDGCERNPAKAMAINAEGTKNIARACVRESARLVYLSTSDVFDGTKKTPYDEDDQPNPINHYGRSKYQGEQAIKEIKPDAYIIRACWLFGGGAEDKKFVAKILELAQVQQVISAVTDVYGSPTYTRDLAEGIKRIVETGKLGLYHLNNRGCCSRYELTQKILEYASRCHRDSRIKDCAVQPVKSADYTTIAPRPLMAAMKSVRLENIGLPNLMRSWEEALEEYLRGTP